MKAFDAFLHIIMSEKCGPHNCDTESVYRKQTEIVLMYSAVSLYLSFISAVL